MLRNKCQQLIELSGGTRHNCQPKGDYHASIIALSQVSEEFLVV
jgi:hypothetical protein